MSLKEMTEIWKKMKKIVEDKKNENRTLKTQIEIENERN